MSVLFDLHNAEGFTDADNAIATFVLESLGEMVDVSINELAERTHTSNATIIRLCRKLGMKGYREFKLNILREAERIPAPELRIDANYPFFDRSSPAAVIKNLADVHRYAVNTCYMSVPALDIQRAASLISQAQRVFLYGLGDSDLVAQIFARRLLRIGRLPFLASFYQETISLARMATPNDVAIFITYSGGAMHQFGFDHSVFVERGCPTILVSSNTTLDSFTQVITLPHVEEVEDNAATYYSTEASLYVLDALYGVLFAMDFDRLRREKRQNDALMRSRAPKKFSNKLSMN